MNPVRKCLPNRPALLVAIVASVCICLNASSQNRHLIETGVEDSLFSQILGEQRTIWVEMPNGGMLKDGQRYPVVYVLDGGMHLGGLAALQQYYAPGKQPEMILVGISNRTHRTRDLTTSEVGQRHEVAVAESGGAETFTRFIAEELIPFVSAKYPASPYRTLIGHSYGGLFAVNTLIHHRDLFDNYIVIDPSLDWDDQKLIKSVSAGLSDGDFDGKGLFLSIANELRRFTETLTIDTVPEDTTIFSLGMRSSLEFVDIAQGWANSGLRFSWKYYEGDGHWSVPLVSMRDGLNFLFDWWELRSPSRYNDPDTPTEELVALARERAARLTAHLGYPAAMEEELLIMMGFIATDTEQTEKARAFFELAAEYYPESADAQDALVDFFVAQGDTLSAIAHARRANEIGSNPQRKERVDALEGTH